MSYVFSESEKNRILEAVSVSSGLLFQAEGSLPYTAVQGNPEANCADVYQVIYDVISEKLSDTSGYDDNTISDLKSARLWFSVAIEANGGTGPYSTLIRDYTLTQGELRLGREFSEGELQGASNQVAANVVNGLLLGDVSGDLAPWTVPSIKQIAALDATAVQRVLFRDALSPADTAVTANSAWSGTWLSVGWVALRRMRRGGLSHPAMLLVPLRSSQTRWTIIRTYYLQLSLGGQRSKEALRSSVKIGCCED